MSFSANECLNQGTFAVTVTKKYYWSHSVGQILTDLNDLSVNSTPLTPFYHIFFGKICFKLYNLF